MGHGPQNEAPTTLAKSYHRDDGVIAESIYIDVPNSTVIWTPFQSYGSRSVQLTASRSDEKIELIDLDRNANPLKIYIPFRWGDQSFLMPEPFLDIFCRELNVNPEPNRLYMYLGSIILKSAENTGKRLFGDPVTLHNAPLCD